MGTDSLPREGPESRQFRYSLQQGKFEADTTAVSTSAALLLAHSLFPEFPSLGVLLLVLLAGGAGFAFIASRRSGHVAGATDPSAVTDAVTTPGTSWLRIPLVTAIVSGLAALFSLVPGIGVIASIVLMPGWIVLWMLFMGDVLEDNLDIVSVVVMAVVSWVVWTASAMIIARVVASFRGDTPSDSTITSIRYH